MNKIYFSFFLFFVLNGCQGAGGISSQHCSRYEYNEQINSWVDFSGQPAFCTISDNEKIFDYIPGQGCSYWQEFHAHDPTFHIQEMVFQLGPPETRVAQRYCVVQRYIRQDSTGQVIGIDNAYCVRPIDPNDKDNLMFVPCSS